jgi:hypothetical protein
LGTVLDRRRRTEVVLNIKVGSKLGAGLDRGLDSKLGLGLELGTGLDRELCTVLVLDIKLGSKLGTGLAIKLGIEHESKLGTAKGKMNISVPTGNRRLWQ